MPFLVGVLIAAIFLALFIWVGYNLFKFMLTLIGYKGKTKKAEITENTSNT
jgi:hypothetical protein